MDLRQDPSTRTVTVPSDVQTQTRVWAETTGVWGLGGPEPERGVGEDGVGGPDTPVLVSETSNDLSFTEVIIHDVRDGSSVLRHLRPPNSVTEGPRAPMGLSEDIAMGPSRVSGVPGV